jgi:hypothetical protein
LIDRHTALVGAKAPTGRMAASLIGLTEIY